MSHHKLNIQLQNTSKPAAGASVLYTEAKYNHLTFSISSLKGKLELNAGNPEKEGQAGSTSTFYLKLNIRKLAPNGLKNVKLELPKGWASQYFEGPGEPNWAICPSVEADLEPSSIDIKLSNIVLKENPGNTVSFSVDGMNIHGFSSWEKRLSVRRPPQVANKDLRESIQLDWENLGYNEVFVSNKGKMYSNDLSFSITNSSGAPLVPPNQDSDSSPTFTLSFVYGDQPGYGALCTPNQASNNIDLKHKKEYGNLWGIKKNVQGDGENPEKNGPNWTLTPGTPSITGTNERAIVSLTISNIITYLEDGLTTLYLSWNNIPGYNDGEKTLEIQKVSPPLIKSFAASPAQVVADDQGDEVEVELSWEIENKQGELWLSWTDPEEGLKQYNVENQSTWPVKVNQKLDTFTLRTAFGPKWDIQYISKELHVPTSFYPPQILALSSNKTLIESHFSIESHWGEEPNTFVELSWEVKHADYIKFKPDFSPWNPLPLKGSWKYLYTSENAVEIVGAGFSINLSSKENPSNLSLTYNKFLSFTLTAYPLGVQEKQDRNLLMPFLDINIPFIDRFSVSVHYMAKNINEHTDPKWTSTLVDHINALNNGMDVLNNNFQIWLYYQAWAISKFEGLLENQNYLSPSEFQAITNDIKKNIENQIFPTANNLNQNLNSLLERTAKVGRELESFPSLTTETGQVQHLLGLIERTKDLMSNLPGSWKRFNSNLNNRELLIIEMSSINDIKSSLGELLLSGSWHSSDN